MAIFDFQWVTRILTFQFFLSQGFPLFVFLNHENQLYECFDFRNFLFHLLLLFSFFLVYLAAFLLVFQNISHQKGIGKESRKNKQNGKISLIWYFNKNLQVDIADRKLKSFDITNCCWVFGSSYSFFPLLNYMNPIFISRHSEKLTRIKEGGKLQKFQFISTREKKCKKIDRHDSTLT